MGGSAGMSAVDAYLFTDFLLLTRSGTDATESPSAVLVSPIECVVDAKDRASERSSTGGGASAGAGNEVRLLVADPDVQAGGEPEELGLLFMSADAASKFRSQLKTLRSAFAASSKPSVSSTGSSKELVQAAGRPSGRRNELLVGLSSALRAERLDSGEGLASLSGEMLARGKQRIESLAAEIDRAPVLPLNVPIDWR